MWQIKYMLVCPFFLHQLIYLLALIEAWVHLFKNDAHSVSGILNSLVVVYILIVPKIIVLLSSH